MSETVNTVEDLRERAFAASRGLERLVDTVDPRIKQRARKVAEDVEAEEQRLVEEADPNAPVGVGVDPEAARPKFSPKTQPRDAQGKFRLVLARLKQDLGTSGNQDVVEKIEEAENLDNAGDYAGAVVASSELIGIVDRLDTGALNAKSAVNVRESTAELGKVISNLPLPFDNQAQKIRYSDLPAALKKLLDSLLTRVEEKIGKEDADIATKDLRGFMSGSDYYSQAEVSSQLNRMLRLLT
ncbi:MAG: hypothetical protein ACRC5T_03745 [Cetobacterium sp.]